MTPFPGPRSLGRGVVLGPDQEVPEPYVNAPVFTIDSATLADAGSTIDDLHRAYAARQPVVVRLLVDHADLRQPEVEARPPWEIGAAYEFARERLQFLIWANTYDMRTGQPIWWHGRKAERIGASRGDHTDIILPDGRTAWVDGGPRGAVAIDDLMVHRESIELGRLHTSPPAPGPPTHDLAPDQLAAVAHPAGAARIIAPAGSGKTRTLTARIEHLRRDRWVEAELLTAVAYNTRAKDEMQDRLGDLPAVVRTIHSLAYRIVRMRRPSAKVITESEQRRLLSPLIVQTPVANKDITAPYLEALRDVRIGLQRPEIVAEIRDDIPGFVQLFDEYREVLRRGDLLDFDEQISEAITILLTDPEVRRRVQLSARHLLVDEFQDLTPAFLLMLRLVAAPAYNVFAVGDDDQVIYGYSGATPDYLIDFADLFPGAHAYALGANYRCPAAVTTAATSLLGYNQRRIAKDIIAFATEDGGLDVVRDKSTLLAGVAAERIERWAEANPLGNIAVLSRVNHALLPIQLELSVRGIPHNAPVGQEFLDRSAVSATLAYLRIGLAPDLISRDDLMSVLNRPSRKISRVGRDVFKRHKRWTITRLRAAANELTGSANERFHGFVDDLELLTAAVDSADTASVIRTIRYEIGLEASASLLDSSRSTADRSGHADDLDALEQIASLFPNPNRFEIELRDLLDRPGSDRGVTLSTVHRVKGMEWPFVIVLPVSNRTMPHHRATDLEEERRIFHVAITRAGRQAVVIADEERPSRFLDELSGIAPAVEPPASGGILASVGQTLTWEGQSGLVTDVGTTNVTVTLPTGYRLEVPYREAVVVDGVRGPLAPLPATDGEPDPALFEALRSWRRERASQDDVPAYIVISDKHLRGIAAARPMSSAELLQCPGIGPTKLERYGDEILATIDGVAAAN